MTPRICILQTRSTAAMLGASKLLVKPAAASYIRISYGKHLDDISALREALGIKPSRRSETVDISPEPTNMASLLSSMSVITKPKEILPASGVIQKVRAGLAYYEWTFFYSRLLPPELQYLTSQDRSTAPLHLHPCILVSLYPCILA